jgi:tRNA dimethylallyltransferase
MGSIIIICGATASGKTDYALDIAQSRQGVIINADAMQVYRELRILTARPTTEQEAGVPHYLYGVVPVSEKCSVAKWLELAKEAIDKTITDKKAPIIVGGTGLYIKALMDGLSPVPEVGDNAQRQAANLWKEQGARALKERDSEMSSRLKPGDMQRNIRSLAVLLATGKSLAYWQEFPRIKPYPSARFDIKYLEVPREELYRRCDARFLKMMESGALEEVKKLKVMNPSLDLPAMRAVGVGELFSFLEGEYSLEEAVQKAQQATRNYAKRQMTWFRNQLKKTPPA